MTLYFHSHTPFFLVNEVSEFTCTRHTSSYKVVYRQTNSLVTSFMGWKKNVRISTNDLSEVLKQSHGDSAEK